MSKSSDAYAQACLHIPGGVNSPVRAFQGVGGEPIFFERAQGAYLYSIEGKEFVDYVGSWGPAILGHNHPEVVAAVTEAGQRGLSFGAPTLQETQLAEKICTLMPSIEMLRLVNSGTEACMSAIRLARAYSKRDKIVKFEGCYHGHADSLLVKAGSGALTLGVPSSPGVPAALAELTLTLPYNDLDAAAKLFSEMGSEIACVIVEPVAGNMNCILPNADFLAGLRLLCDEHSSLLIFDEVMCGFRVALGGAQQHYQVKPDLTTLGKVIGGGLPVGAFGGRREIMQMLAPLGPVYQAGTLSGNPLATAAGLKTLELLSRTNFYTELAEKTSRLTAGLIEIAKAAGVPLSKNQLGGMFGLFFSTTNPITSFAEVQKCDVNAFKQFFHGMLEQGIYLAPSAFEAGFVSAAHGNIELEKTLQAAKHTFSKL